MARRIIPLLTLWDEVSGTRFNLKTQGTRFYKLTFSNEVHNGFQYRDGLNWDSRSFIPLPNEPGLHFTEEQYIPVWIDLFRRHGTPLVYKRLVTIPDDAQVYTGYDWMKADQLILGTREEI